MSRRRTDPLDPRARQLLRSLIARHIRDGEPVGSQTLARHAGLDVSAATIRNILSDLEEVGLLSAPHASAGRVPTARGCRVFVGSLLQLSPLADSEFERLRDRLDTGGGTQELLGSASELVSAMTRFVGVVSVPGREQFAFRQIDFVPIDARRVMAIVVFADNEVQNRIVHTRRACDAAELERVANYLNSRFAGQPLPAIRATLTRELRSARSEMEELLRDATDIAGQAMAPGGEDIVVAGQARLLGVQDLADLDRLRDLFEAFAEKRGILQLLEQTAKAPGVRVFFGEETGVAPLAGMSLVTAPYGTDGRVLGVLGVIGPARMAYDRVIPVVQATADVLGAALKPEPASPLSADRDSPDRRER
ncbi:MAG: heat-inducible transcriptional repressor HrcA [Gammaproteobacteria bacterium]|nr:heat-inducible transcriptional repressor HrcA [Gammaproteobacteria bacterium]